ncbi:MAG: phosphatidate cytidylyltransferase [Chloroflexi bacterium]|nr:phosphatidate cytidylyltransferase [Chloroflexota bacterium]
MAARFLTALASVPPLVAAIWFGFPWLVIAAAAAAVAGTWEFSRLAQRIGARPLLPLSLFWSLAYVFNGHWGGQHTGAVVSGGLLLSLFWLVIKQWRAKADSAKDRQRAVEAQNRLLDWASTVLGPLYVGWTLAYALLLHQLPHGREWLLLVVFSTFATDTAAFLVGRWIGRRPMAPSVSPGKTWEGAVGGLIGALLASLGLSSLLSLPMAWWLALVTGGILGVVAQVGDLSESWLKRTAGVKEAGQLLPGHGGILDRLDSVVFTLVTMYYVVGWVTR